MSRLFNAENIFQDTESCTQQQAFEFIAQKAAVLGYVNNAADYAKGLMQREKESSTGFTGGMAIPHCKHATIQHAGVFVVNFSHPIEWDAIDGKPVTTALALAIPDDGDMQNLRLLTQLSRKMVKADFRAALQQGDEAEILKTIEQALA